MLNGNKIALTIVLSFSIIICLLFWNFNTHAFSCYALGGYSITSAESSEPIHKQSQPIWKIYTDYLRRQPWILVYGLCELRQRC